ncbi:MAG: hypothetical protein JWO25_2314, partial [Alphaproteobacteria bacterium]|nr:hypothetical protein [Alphaproteobacteria bacterium]
TDRFEAEDDQAALTKALGKASPHEMELWCGHRRILVLEPAAAGAESDS